MPLRVATAIEKGTDSEKIGISLAQKAQKKLNTDIALAILYVSSEYDCQKVVKAVRKTLNNAPLIGCTTGGEFTDEKSDKGSVALALLSKTDNYKFHIAIAEGLQEDAQKCVKTVLDQLPKENPDLPNRSAILLHDGLAGRGEETVLYTGLLLGSAIPFAGGSAADDLKFEETFVFCNDEVKKDAVVLCLIDSKEPIANSVKHGHVPVSCELTVTKSKDNIVYEVNDRPAWDVWKEILKDRAKEELNLNLDQLTDPTDIGTFLIRYELGLNVDEGEYKIRVPLSKNEDGSLNFASTIFEGSKFCIMRSTKDMQIDSAQKAAQLALEGMGNKKIAAALVFDCVCRAIILGDQFGNGVHEMQKIIGKKVPMIGFETYGEICKLQNKMSGYHNTTTVMMLLPE